MFVVDGIEYTIPYGSWIVSPMFQLKDDLPGEAQWIMSYDTGIRTELEEFYFGEYYKFDPEVSGKLA